MTQHSTKARLGQSHGRARLTESDVLAIREWADACARAGSTPPYKAKAAEYNVSEGSLRDIVARRTWTHLEGPAPAPRRKCLPGFPPDVELTEAVLRDQLAKHLQRSGGMLPRRRDLLPDFACRWSLIKWRIRAGSVAGIDAQTDLQWMLTLVRPADATGVGDVNLSAVETTVCEPASRLRNHRKTRNLAGQRFGALVADHKVPGRHRRRGTHWSCNCDCGRSVVVYAGFLQDGLTRSCGCALPWRLRWVMREAGDSPAQTYRRLRVFKLPPGVELTGALLRDQLAKHLQRSGGMLPRLPDRLPDFTFNWRLVAQRISSGCVPGITAKNRMQWMLTVLRPANEIDQTENVPAPLPRTNVRTRDLAGQRFGKLVAERRAPSRPGRSGSCWFCKCDCGRSANVMAQELLDGYTKSCGCASPSKLRWVIREADSSSAI